MPDKHPNLQMCGSMTFLGGFRMLRTIIWYMVSWMYLIITFPALIWVKFIGKSGKLSEQNRFAEEFSMVIARTLFYLTGSSLTIKGIENIPEDQHVLFVSNHQSHMDSAIIHGFIKLPKGFIADKEAQNIPILRTWMKYMKCIFVDRTDKHRNIRGMEESLKTLKGYHSLVIYPEGKLDEGKDLKEFKKGFIKLAVKAGVPIVPVTIADSCRVMNRKGSRISSAHVKCIVSEPISLSELIKEDENKMIRKIRGIISENLSEEPISPAGNIIS